MPKQYPSEVRGRAVRMVLDRLDGYPSLWAVCQDIGLELDVGPKSLGTWVVQVQTDAGQRSGPTSNELDEIRPRKARGHGPRGGHRDPSFGLAPVHEGNRP
jgi:transposase